MRTATRRGSALIVALWVILLLSMLIGSFAFNMQIEAEIASYYRKRVKAQYLARGGIDFARVIIAESDPAAMTEEPEGEGLDADLHEARERLQKGARVYWTRQVAGGKLDLAIYPAESRWNVNKLTEEQWKVLLESTGVPEERWPELIDCFMDWVDENDLHRLNGAESDDPFYEERGYEVKNAPVDVVEELLLIKGFDDEVMFGTPPGADTDTPMLGIARHLTTWSDGRLNPNSASYETLLTAGMVDWQAEAVVQHRSGPDGLEGTEDDRLFEDLQELLDIASLSADYSERFTLQEIRFHRVESVGSYGAGAAVRAAVTAIVRLEQKKLQIMSWSEELLP